MNNSLLNRLFPSALTKSNCRGAFFFLPKTRSSSNANSKAKTCPGTLPHPERNPKLRDDISTDEITPAHICFFFDETLGEFPYTGLKCGNETPIKRGDVKRGGFVACVSGKRRGKGSSREQSPYAEMSAGIQWSSRRISNASTSRTARTLGC